MLLLAAAAATVDLATLRRADTVLALDLAGLAAAEDVGLIRLHEGQVEFTHPLLRSASYYTAAPDEQRAAHRALADVSDPGKEPTRRAWHLAAAIDAPDESVAATLDLAAQVADGRNAFGAASRAYQRAAELSVDLHRQVSRWIAAGRAAHLSGDPAAAVRMLRLALDHAADPRVRADTLAWLAQAAVYTGPPMDLYHELAAGADAVLALDPVRAAILLASASDICRMVGKLGLASEAATNAARPAGPAGGIGWLLSQVALAQVTIPIRTPTLWCRMPDMTTMDRDGRDALCLAQLEAPLREQAMARFAMLRPHLEDGVPLGRAAGDVGVAVGTAQRWLARYRACGLAALARRSRADTGRRRLPAEVAGLIEGLALRKPRPTVAAIHRRALAAAQQHGWPAPSYGTVYAIARTLDPALVTLAHKGQPAFRDRFELAWRHRASRPNALWQADHTELDVLVLEANGTAARPWLTIVIDDHCRAIAGYTVFFGAPSALHTSLALRQAIWRKTDPTWPVCGIPDVLYVVLSA